MRRFPIVVVLALLAPPAGAVEDLLTPRSVAMGDSLRADATGALGPLLNPAGMTLVRSYTIEAMYGFRVQDTGSNLLGAIVDSITSRVSAGVYYVFVHGSPHLTLVPGGPVEGTREGHETGLSLAIPFADRFAFGITTKYMTVATDVPNPAFDAKTNPGVPQRLTIDSTTSAASASGFTMDTGLTLRLGDSFVLGVVGYNLVPLRSIEAPMSLGTGLAYHVGTTLTLAADFVVDFNKYRDRVTGNNLVTERAGGGFEWLIGGKFAVRGGASWDGGRPGTYVSMGLAYVGTSFAVDVAYKQQVQGGPESLIVGGLRVFLQ